MEPNKKNVIEINGPSIIVNLVREYREEMGGFLGPAVATRQLLDTVEALAMRTCEYLGHWAGEVRAGRIPPWWHEVKEVPPVEQDTSRPEVEATAIQKDTLRFLLTHFKTQMSWPSLREVGKHFGISHGATKARINALTEKGYLEPREGEAREFKILRMPDGSKAEGRIRVIIY